MHTDTTHSLLLKTSTPYAPGTDMRWFEALQNHFNTEVSLQSVSTAQAENQQPMHHVYLHFANPQQLRANDVTSAAKIWHVLSGHEAQVSRLQRVMRLPGQPEGQTPLVHYVVETDPQTGWRDEIFRWYDQEHLPGLSRVPGTVLAQRFVNLDHPPRSFACYDLVAADVLASEAWLAVRGTPWSDVCRPHFTNTLRTMFENINA